MARAEVTVVLSDLEPVKAKLAELTARAEQAEAAIQRVRELHVRMADSVAERLGFVVPDLCKADYNTWPCPTVAALDSTEPPPPNGDPRKLASRRHASPGCACGVNDAGAVFIDPLCASGDGAE